MTLLRTLPGTFFIGTALILTGCTAPEKKPLQARGWMGGEYKVVHHFPKMPLQSPKAAVLVTALATNTPARAAGLQEGDLILSLDHQPVTRLTKFRWKIDDCKPGTVLPVTALRDGQTVDCNVVVGKETYRNGGFLNIGLFPGAAWQLPWPGADNRGFSLGALGYKLTGENRRELGAASNVYDRKCDPKSEIYDQDYDVWLAVIEVNKGKNIVAQEIVEAKN